MKIKKYANYDFRLHEDAKWLLDNRPPNAEWGTAWFTETDISRKHFPPGFLTDYPRLIIGSRLGNARAQVELLSELAEDMSIVLAGVAISEDDRMFIAIFDTTEPDENDEDPGRDNLMDFVRAACYTTINGLPPGQIPLQMVFEGRDVFDAMEFRRVPKLWASSDK